MPEDMDPVVGSMRVVGIDQSYTGFGYCVDGVSKKKIFPASKYKDDVDRLDNIRDWFETWLSQEHRAGLNLVVMEGYANAAKFGREMAGELGGVVKLAVRDVTGTSPLIVPPTSLKKFVTGKGNAKKNEMLLGVYKRWGQEFSDDNQADAYSLEQFGLGYLDRDPAFPNETGPKLTQFQIEAIEAVRKGK